MAESIDYPARAARAVNGLLNRFLVRGADGSARPLPYNPVDYQTLRYLAEAPDARATDVAAHLGAPPTTMQSALDRLLRKGLLEKRASPTDGRARLYRLSERGQDIRARIQAQDRANMAAMLSELPEADRARLVGYLERLAK